MTDQPDDEVKVPAAPARGPHPDPGPAADGAKASVAAKIGNLRAPLPIQQFSHVGPDGNSYVSDDKGLITPLSVEDAAALRLQGCVDV
jgi:hypothetical protein